MKKITTILCQQSEINTILAKLINRYIDEDNFNLVKFDTYQYNIDLDDGYIIIKAKADDEDVSDYINWFIDRNTGNYLFTQRMGYLKNYPLFKVRVKDGYLMIDSEEI